MIGVYCLKNKINGKLYVGASVDVKKRWRRHVRNLRKRTAHNSLLQREYDEYGPEAFDYEIIQECSKEQLRSLEEHWILFFGSLEPNGYNVYMSGRRRNNRAMTDALKRPEVRAKMSESAKRRTSCPEFRKRQSDLMKSLWSRKNFKGRWTNA